MSQFYTVEQIDQIATVVGNEIKQTKSEIPSPALNFNSFMEAFNSALNSGDLPGLPGTLTPYSQVSIGSRSGASFYNYMMSINGTNVNNSASDLVNFWNMNKIEFGNIFQNLNIEKDVRSGDLAFYNNNLEDTLHIVLTPMEGSITDMEYIQGSGLKTSGNFEFLLSPSATSST